MEGDEEIFSVVHYAQLRLDAPVIVRNWLSDPANNANISDEHAFSLLHWAVIGGVVEVIALLLDHGARVNIMNAGGDTPLHLAAQLNRVDAAGLLLTIPGIMTATPNAHGNTPLHYATFYNCHNVAVLLAANGAPVTVQNKNGLTPLQLANPELAAELRDIAAGVKSSSPTPFSAPHSVTSPGASVTDGASSNSVGAVGLASLDLREKLSESRDATCWFGSCEGVPVVARSLHLKRRRLPARIAIQLLAETERLRAGRGTLAPHMNILPLLSCVIDNHGAGEPLLLSRYQQLGSLFNVLHSGSGALGNRPKFVMDQRQTYRIALDIANGMEYIHGMLQDTSAQPLPRFHLNSRNVLIDVDPNDIAQEPVARLYLAKCDLPGNSDPRVIRYPAWFSPEELINPPHLVRLQPADMWSMGVVLFELVTLCVPFAGLSAVEIGVKVALEGARVHLFSKAPGVSAHVERLLGICMNENPECRPSFDQIVPVFRRMVAAANASAPS